MVRSHEQNVRNWLFSRPGMGTATPYASGSGLRRLVFSGDRLDSYGSHFPLVTLIRTKSGKPSHFLVSGDTWSGGWSMTSAHQDAVRSVMNSVEETLGMKHVIIPQSVIDAAGIDVATMQIVEVTQDWHEQRVEEFDAEPPGSYWVTEKTTLPGTGVYVSQRTGEVFEPGWQGSNYLSEPPGKPNYGDYMLAPSTPEIAADRELREAERQENYARFLVAEQVWRGNWIQYPTVDKRTGRKRLMLNHHSFRELELYEREDGTVGYRYAWERHWLGESLIKGRVPYVADARCPKCSGTGIHPYAEVVHGAEGPMTERQDLHWTRWQVPDVIEPRHSLGSRIEERCDRCLGRRRIRVTRHRWAYFLSGFDSNEPRPSYFFSELPPGVKPKTVAEAYATLKPRTVSLAEEMGRTVLRQGDQWFVEMPGLTLRELKKQGGVHHKRGGPGQEHQLSQPAVITHKWQIPRFQRLINMDCWLHGTTHEATEVVRVGGLTYARGIVRHVPEQRTPDHIRLPLGDRKTWFLCIPNGTPTGV